MRVEVVYALPERQELIELEVDDNASIKDVIERSSMTVRVPELVLKNCEVGIWGRVADLGTRVHDGDRVEIYRPLETDPRDARRLRAKASD